MEIKTSYSRTTRMYTAEVTKNGVTRTHTAYPLSKAIGELVVLYADVFDITFPEFTEVVD